MTTTTSTTQDFTSTQTTPLVRINSLAMAILHIPSLAAGVFGVFASIMVFPLLPVTITLFWFGTILYNEYWSMYKDKLPKAEAQKIWKRTFYFNILLLVPAVWINIAIGMSIGWFIVGFILVSIFLAKTALNDLKNI